MMIDIIKLLLAACLCFTLIANVVHADDITPVRISIRRNACIPLTSLDYRQQRKFLYKFTSVFFMLHFVFSICLWKLISNVFLLFDCCVM